MSLLHQDPELSKPDDLSKPNDVSKPDDLSDTHSQTGSEPPNQHDDEGTYSSNDEPEESADEKWVHDFHKIRQMLHEKITDDRHVDDKEWNSGSKDEQYRALLDKCLRLERCRPSSEKPDTWEALSCLQFVIKKIDGLRAEQFNPNFTMANILVRLIIASVSKMGSGHLLPLLQVSSDTNAVSEAPKYGATQGNNWDEKSSPLFMAIQLDVNAANNSRGLTVFMCENLPETDRKEALAAKNKNNETWLHAALLADLEGVEKMIKWAPVSVFCERRRATGLEDGNTPLHDALNYKNHIAPFPLCSGTHPKFEKQPVVFAPELDKAMLARSTRKPPCDTCVDAAKQFQKSRVRWDCIVKELLNQDIRALRAHNTSGRPPYLYYLHTRAMYIDQLPKKIDPTNLCGQSPAVNTDSAGNRAKGKTSNPKSADDVNPAKKDDEPDKKDIPDRGKTSHNSKKLEDTKKLEDSKKSYNKNWDETKKSGDNKKSDDNKRFDNKKLDDLRKPMEIEVSEKGLNTGNEPSSPKKQLENIKASDESKTPESNNRASLKPPIQLGKSAVHFPDPEHNVIVPGDQNKEGLGLELKLVRRMSQVSGAENRQPNTSVKRPPGKAPKPKSSSHKQFNLPTVELTVGLEALLKETAYIVGGYKEAYECLFRTQKHGQDMGSDDQHRVQSWNLDTKDARISINTKSDFDFFIFEPMMSSVRIDLRDTESEEDLRALTPEGKFKRWADMQGYLTVVFKWLKDEKKVKSIMRLVVRDRGPIFCSDETVEKCLEGLEVRYLDWDRPDMCTDTLLTTPDLVQVDLYWSGLKAVLSSWGDTNGLRKLQRLRDVDLHAEKGREEKERMKKYVENFIAEAARDWQRPEGGTRLPQIHDRYSDASTDGENKNMNPNTGTPQNDNHPWFIKATKFAEQLGRNSWRDLERLKVKVAVIDDGVSPTYEGVSKYLHHPGWPYNGEKAQENFTSTNGHGSKMAYLITRICPFVEIYVAKLDADTTTFRERTFRLDAAKKAIEWATSRGVDVISMSWNVRRTEGIGKDPGNLDEATQLGKAIDFAAKEKNILMYCAAGDQKGAIGSTKWVPCDSENTISIGATDINGTKKGYVVDNKQLAYLFPGENILKETDDDSKDVGNSGATALAAGLAAMVLFFSRAKNINIEKRSLKEYMERVFDKVFNATEHNSKVVQVADVLGEEKSKLETFEKKLKGVQWP
ncbi:MAG: hypothetical protein Q9178_005717 [Gyalolechia marmorata]